MQILADWENNGYLPKAYTCEGIGNFPQLTIKEIPLAAKCLVLIVDDPDAPGGTRYHLVMANLPIEAQTMEIGKHDFHAGLSGQNSRGELGRGAPCPPHGVHRYIFKAYAIKENLDLSSGFTVEGVWEKMQGNVIAQAELVGLYQKSL